MTSMKPLRLCVGFLLFALTVSALGVAAAATTRSMQLSVGNTSNDSGWQSPQNVSASPGVDSEAPALTVTEDGTVHLVWEEGDQLYHSYRTAESWSEPARIGGTRGGEQPALAAGPGNTVHLVYANYVSRVDNFEILYVSWSASGWAIPQNLSQTTQVSDSPDIAAGADGSIHVVATETAAKRLYYAETDGVPPVTWTYGPIRHEFGFAYGEGAAIDVIGIDTVYVAYKEEDQDIYTTVRSGTAWSPPENVSDSLAANSTAPDLVADENGTVHVVWQEEISGIPQIQYVQGGEAWSPVVTLSLSAAGAHLPALAMGGREQLHALWYDDAFPATVRHAWRPASTSDWGSPSIAYATSSSLDDVVVSAGLTAPLHAAWVEGDTGDILYARKAPPCHVFLPVILSNVQK